MDKELICIFESGDMGQAQIAKSLLDDAGIRYMVKNEGVQNLFGLGGMGGMNPIVGAIRILVHRDDEQAACDALSQLDEGESTAESPEMPADPEPEAEESRSEGFLSRLSRWLRGY